MSADQAQAAFGEPGEPRRASALGYWLAGLIGVAAVGGAIAWFIAGFGGLSDRVDALQRVPIPGAGTLTLEAGGTTLYYEGPGGVPGLDLSIRALDGSPVKIHSQRDDTAYTLSGHHGQSVAGFHVDRTGRYRIRVSGHQGGELAVGHGVGGKIVGIVLGGIGIFFGGLLLCGLAIILTARRRRG
ncbi:MAG: hypothetical protein ACJ762_19065 [Solirubrobacteraceae bacterium]